MEKPTRGLEEVGDGATLGRRVALEEAEDAVALPVALDEVRANIAQVRRPVHHVSPGPAPPGAAQQEDLETHELGKGVHAGRIYSERQGARRNDAPYIMRASPIASSHSGLA